MEIYYEDYRLKVVKNESDRYDIYDKKFGGRIIYYNGTKEQVDEKIQFALRQRGRRSQRIGSKTFDNSVKKYQTELRSLNFEITWTSRLGWIAIRTDYHNCSDPIKQFKTPAEMEEYIVSQIEVAKLDK